MINKKGFTVIELAAVILVLGILFFIAKPSFMRNVDKAKLSHIQYEIKVAENEIEELMIMDRMPDNWETKETFYGNYNIYGLKGLIENLEENKYQLINVKTKLDGKFIANLDGKVFYLENKK